MSGLIISLGVCLLAITVFSSLPLFHKHYRHTLSWRKHSIALCLLIIFSLSLYSLIGAAPSLATWKKHYQAHYQVMDHLQQKLSNPKVLDHLKAHLKQHPEEIKGWFYLGELYLFKREYANAEKAFAKVLQLAPNNKRAMMLKAQAKYYQDNAT